MQYGLEGSSTKIQIVPGPSFTRVFIKYPGTRVCKRIATPRVGIPGCPGRNTGRNSTPGTR
eukprot:1779016-Rhodomonas_salina.1